jgi:outer membrane receptor protein involved in Fe transport
MNHPKKTPPSTRRRVLLPTLLILGAALISPAQAQKKPAPAPLPTDEVVLTLAPFEVNAEDTKGYMATNTLGGTRIRTELIDVGSAISVYTPEFLQDIGAFDNETLLAFAVGADVGGAQGTFLNANSQGEENENFGAGNSNTRIRGLAAADNTLNYFKTEASWDGYNTSRVEIVRGANSILFGLGSPAGIINAGTNRAQNRNAGRMELRTDQFGTQRVSLDYNRVLSKDVLAGRISLLHNHQQFRQESAFKKDQRVSFAAKYIPKQLQTKHSTFKIEASGEVADIAQNTRRGAPPLDHISYFFLPESQGGLGGNTVNRNDPADQRFLFLDFGLPTQRANPMISNAWGNGTTVMVYDRSVQPLSIFEKEINSVNGYRFLNNQVVVNAPTSASASATSISGTVQPVFLNGAGNYAQVVNKPFATSGRWGEQVLTDSTYYDFYNNLIDGDSKREMSKWKIANLDVTQTFFDNRISYNLQYFHQQLESDRYAALGASSVIYVDASELLPDGSPNPHAGKAYLRESPFSGQRAATADRDSYRGTLYLEHDFRKSGDNSRLRRLLGKHYVTGSLSQQTVKQTRFDYMAIGPGMSWVNNRLVDPLAVNRDPFTTRARLLNYFYVSDSLVGKKPGNLGLTNLGPAQVVKTGTYDYRYFDANTAFFNPNVNPGATDPTFARAAQNPNNYRGWTNGKIDIVGAATDRASRDYLTRTRDYFKEEIATKSFVWQGKFLGGSLVGTYGGREDNYSSWQYNWDQARELLSDFKRDRANFGFAPTETVGRTTNWSAVVHLHALWKPLPIRATLQYNRGQNTNPDPARIGVFRNPVFSAEGETTDTSIVLSDRQNRINFRVTKYETQMQNASSTSTLQSQKFLLEQTFNTGFDNVYRILNDKEAGWGAIDPALESRINAGTATAADRTTYANQQVNVPRNIAAANAWLAFESGFAQRFPKAVSAWATGGFNPSTRDPNATFSYPENAVLLEDTISRGYEFELTANPTRNWRVAANASMMEAVRDNIPGAEFSALMDYVWEQLNGAAGQVPFAIASGAPTDNSLRRFSGFYDSYQVQLQNNGQSVRELSKWRYSLVTNYAFSSGRLKGLSLGLNYRYEDPKVIGYGLKTEGTRIVTDINTRYYNEAVQTWGLSARYGMRLSDQVNWSVQANLINAFQGNKVLATATQPDGSIARGMIREGASWTLSNTFTF